MPGLCVKEKQPVTRAAMCALLGNRWGTHRDARRRATCSLRKWINRIVSALPEKLDRGKAEKVVRALVSREIALPDRSKGEQETA